MSRPLVLPKLGLTMTEGAIAAWNMEPGARFAAGQIIVSVESEKVVFEVDAPADGTLVEILVPQGETVPVGTEIGRWQLDGDAVPERAAASAPPPRLAKESGGSPALHTPPPRSANAVQHRILATPLARRSAAAAGLDLAGISGTGPRGRIQQADVDAAQAVRAALPAPSGTHDAPSPPSAFQRTMADRMVRSKREIPHFYLSVDVEMSAALSLRKELTAAGTQRISVTHLIIAAAVHALRENPGMNRVWTDESIVRQAAIDVGLAVDTPRGLLNPMVRDLARLGFLELVRRTDETIARTREGRLDPADLGGGALSISNAGMHELRYMQSIIVPGQSAILGIGSIQSVFRPDEDGAPVIRRELGVVLSADHRLHTGIEALAFLTSFRTALQKPLHMLAGIQRIP